MVWCGVTQSAIGFSSCLILPLIFAAHAIVPKYFTDLYMQGAINLWYLTVIFPILGSGVIITVQSWIVAYRERDLLSMGTAAWNTFAMAYDTYNAVEGIGPALSSVWDAISSAIPSSSDEDDSGAMIGLAIMLLVVVAALGGGVVITMAIVKHYAGSLPVPANVRRYARAT
jgi:hypothetical protein